MADEEFTMGNTAQERGFSHVPKCYQVSSSDRPNSAHQIAHVPVIDFTMLRQGPDQRADVINQIRHACHHTGFFQIVHHGICQTVLDGALSVASDFFKLPAGEKRKLMSSDVHKPVRYGTSIKDGLDKIQFWRVFLKHYAHPLADWINLWPEKPSDYREKMGKYCTESRKLALELMEAITESLGLGPTYLSNKMEEGTQVMAVNCYPPCPNPQTALGLPPHSDYTCITIVLQSSEGLEILTPSGEGEGEGEEEGKWGMVLEIHGALQVNVGDHLEVLSNGVYKSAVHRVTLKSESTRMSIASLHSLGMDEKVGTAEELVDEHHPKKYKESSFRDFLNFLSKNDISEGKSFMDALKIKDK